MSKYLQYLAQPSTASGQRELAIAQRTPPYCACTISYAVCKSRCSWLWLDCSSFKSSRDVSTARKASGAFHVSVLPSMVLRHIRYFMPHMLWTRALLPNDAHAVIGDYKTNDDQFTWIGIPMDDMSGADPVPLCQ
jgi:hypothetical protein